MKIKFTLLICLCFIAQEHGYAQKSKLNNSDCENAIDLSDSLKQPFISKGGHGEIQEMWGDKTEEEFYFSKEENSSWYRIVAPYKAIMTLEIKPTNAKSDIDFLLFESLDENTCDMIKTKEIKPVRSNIARYEEYTGGATGLSSKGTSTFVSPGYGNNFSTPLDTERGKEYFLLLNNLAEDKLGHTINVWFAKQEVTNFDNLGSYEAKSVEQNTTVVNAENSGISLKVNVVDSKEGKPINVDLEVDGIVPGKPMVVENQNSFTYILEKRKTYQVKCIYQGFLLYSEEIVAPDQAEKINLNIQLDPIAEGAKVALHNIKFKPNGAYILRSSESELTALVKFMEKNPTVEIKINGHVNGPKMANTGELKKLSRERAKAVYKYLIEQGVSKKRLNYDGLGNSEMLYPIPLTHDQERANRRVEIEIMKQ